MARLLAVQGEDHVNPVYYLHKIGRDAIQGKFGVTSQSKFKSRVRSKPAT